MATYSIYKGHYIRPYRNVRLRTMPEAASQTFIVGDPLNGKTTLSRKEFEDKWRFLGVVLRRKE